MDNISPFNATSRAIICSSGVLYKFLVTIQRDYSLNKFLFNEYLEDWFPKLSDIDKIYSFTERNFFHKAAGKKYLNKFICSNFSRSLLIGCETFGWF